MNQEQVQFSVEISSYEMKEIEEGMRGYRSGSGVDLEG